MIALPSLTAGDSPGQRLVYLPDGVLSQLREVIYHALDYFEAAKELPDWTLEYREAG